MATDHSTTALNIEQPAPPALRPAYLLSALLAVATLGSLLIDIPVSNFFCELQNNGPGDLRKFVSLFEAFAHTAGVIVIVLAVAVLDPMRRRAALRVAACAFGSGLVADFAKVLIGRTRPNELWANGLPESGWQTFLGLVPALQSETFSEGLRRGVQSFPSGHSAMAAGLAMGLAWLYPQGKWFFAFLAVMAMFQRIECGAHFPSDTLAGASLGVFFAATCCDPRLFGGWFDKWGCVK